MDKIKLGQKGEKMAEFIYMKYGYQVLHKNLRTRFGEIDLVVQKRSIVYLVEVKIASNNSFGESIEKWSRNQHRRFNSAARALIANGTIKSAENLRCEFIAFDNLPNDKVKFKRYTDISINL